MTGGARVVEGMVERDLETAHLLRAIDHSWHGVGRLVVIEGPAGIGKTTLLGAARELARRAGMSVRGARGAELEQGFAFGVVRQLLEPALATAGEAQRGEWLSGAAELAAPLFDPRSGLAHGREESIYPRLHGLYWLCINIALRQPLLLCVDDVQWADEPSVAFLGFLARRLEELPILVVTTMRAIVGRAPAAVTALLREPAARHIRPRPLSPEGVERMLSRQLGYAEDDRLFARACHEATAGNPFLVAELVRELEEGGIEPLAVNAPRVASLAPPRVADGVLARLHRLGTAAAALALAVAILGDGARLSTAALFAGIDEQEALAAAAAMRGVDLLER